MMRILTSCDDVCLFCLVAAVTFVKVIDGLLQYYVDDVLFTIYLL